MYVKIFQRILDSSIAGNRRLRHFFIDLLLCADPDGNVMMTNERIADRIKADPEEVKWGLAELQKPDGMSFHHEHRGRRIEPLDGHGYGWKILNYAYYRDLKTAEQLRKQTAERVKRFRERQQAKHRKKPEPLRREPLRTDDVAHNRNLNAGLEDENGDIIH